ncbi:hypothetical protein CDD80_6861 [Ophiocordyceps camponoti-rufipedis]|uniref:Cytidyltransferase-like domain-containing protein n=1 Tax=Ophiocordyceps camponoti-rufipedis TaxID=2004952 RepID=A0A2C5YNH8_9HYPO|nr:hypothetical protein CDD80_6861 [Ophiocordyceps camponoti-rufipedis]
MTRPRHLALDLQTIAAEQGLSLHLPPLDAAVLHPGKANQLLVFPGSFNPPHRGHEALLEHVLVSDGSLVGAIVIPTDDSKLAAKNRHDGRPLLLSKEQRVALWRGSGFVSRDRRVWIFDGSEAVWAVFRERLRRRLARFDVRFVLLTGPDLVTSRCVVDPGSWGCVDSITSDVSRPADFRSERSLRQLPGCTPWEPCSASGDKGGSVPASVDYDPLGYPLVSAAALWECQTSRKPLRRYRFAASSSPGSEHAPSSTEIRRVIASFDGIQLEREMQRLALNPLLLLRLARQGGPYSAPVVRDRGRDHQSRKAKVDEQANW